MPNRLFLIDGHALIFKMYYAFLRRPMINSKGMDTSILYGFTKYVLELIAREEPTHLAVAFDPPGGTFRNKMYPEYKATREATPQLVIDALAPLTELCHALNIPTLLIPGFEADDVIGTVALREAGEGTDVVMVTPDKDYGQLVGDHVRQLRPGKAGGADELLGKAEICAKYGISDPSQVIEMLTLCGDTADNVPGVKGVGEVGAAKLVARYGSVEGIYAHLGQLSERQRAMFEDARGHIGLSHELVTIKTDVPVETALGEMAVDKAYGPRAAELFELYEFSSLRRYLGDVKAPVRKMASFDVREVSPSELCALAGKDAQAGIVTLSDGEDIFSEITGIVLAARSGDSWAWAEGGIADFSAVLSNPGIAKCGENLKFQLNLLSAAGLQLEGRLFDIELMHYLVNPEQSHRPEVLAPALLEVSLEEEEEAPQSLFGQSEVSSAASGKKAAVCVALKEKLSGMMAPASLYDSMEEPLLRVLARMERNGVKVDLPSLKEFATALRKEMESLEEKIREEAGEPGLNISSPKQIGELLFDKLALDPKAKKSARGAYSTDEATLLAVSDKHPIVGEILEYRAVRKLLSTYIEPFHTYISPVTGKVHTTFNQALTATGRLSSSNPNLQNIPIRTERGMQIRKAFVPSRPDGLIMSADYSQIELRIMAHLSCDEHLIASFKAGEDIHAATAAKIFGIPVGEVTREQRGMAKTANFGIMYGISSFGLSQRLHIARGAAKKLIDDYFAAFPSIRLYIDDTVAAARENGYVETIFGRRRYLPDIVSRNATVRSLAERNAVNAPIQGSSADIIKLAMTAVDRRIREEGLESRMVLQVHDELVFDVLPGEADALREIAVSEMENVISLSVPLTVECNVGKNWLEAH